MFGTVVQLAQQFRLTFSTSVGPCFEGSDLAEHIHVEKFNISPVETLNVVDLFEFNIVKNQPVVIQEVLRSFS